MSPILDKKQMTEEDVKLNFITPALVDKGWRDKITMETKVQLTDGKINLRGNVVTRKSPKKTDYILYANASTPIAIVEAKDNKHKIADGIQQAMEYARMMDIPFAYSSNGDGFYEHDFLTGQEREFSRSAFPTPDELQARFEAGANNGQGLSDAEKKIAVQPYYTSAKTYSLRYYQRKAVNRTLDAIAHGQQRLLLVMATGTGKTYTAFQIVYRLLKSGMKKKVLYLADRNFLVDQARQQDFAPLEKAIHKINFATDKPSTVTAHEVYFALYQQLTDREDNADDAAEDETVSRLVRITGSDLYGKSKLKYFISASMEGPIIATTSKLLSTGADCNRRREIFRGVLLQFLAIKAHVEYLFVPVRQMYCAILCGQHKKGP